MANVNISDLTPVTLPAFANLMEIEQGGTNLSTTLALLLGLNVATQNFRLTTESGVPVSPSDRTAQSTLYFTPANGNRISLYNGSAWVILSSAQVSLALSGLTSGKNYDVFAYSNSGTLTLELSAAWADNNTPTDAITTQDGIPVKSGATTRRWVGTMRTTGTTTIEDSQTNRFLWNLNNQVRRNFGIASQETHDYNTGTNRPFNNSATQTLSTFVTGQAQSVLLGFAGKCGTVLALTQTNALMGPTVNGTDLDQPVLQTYGTATLISGGQSFLQESLTGYNSILMYEAGFGTSNSFVNGQTFGSFWA